MDSLPKRQGNRLREARIQAGFKKSRREAAIACSWSYSTYAAHERGTRTMGRDDIDKYMRKFRSLGSTITAESVMYPDSKTASSRAESDYDRGWRDAVEHLASIAQSARPSKKRGA